MIKPSRRRHRTGVTLMEVVIALSMAVILGALALPTLHKLQEENRRKTCADNLRAIALTATLYSNEEVRSGSFPRTYWNTTGAVSPTQYTGVNAPKSFSPGMPGPNDVAANDVTAALYLLPRTLDLDPAKLVCPGGPAKPLKFPSGGVKEHSNFPGREFLGYSYANPYPKMAAVQAGWRFSAMLGAEAPLIADMNPGGSKVQMTAHDAGPDAMKAANSPNHGGAGQNVAYCDGHVEWQPTPYCGMPRQPTRDNIYTVGGPVKGGPGGSAVKGPPEDAADMVLLPVWRDGPQLDETPMSTATDSGGAIAARAAGGAGGKSGDGAGLPWLLIGIGGGILALGAIAGVIMMTTKKKVATQPGYTQQRPPGR